MERFAEGVVDPSLTEHEVVSVGTVRPEFQEVGQVGVVGVAAETQPQPHQIEAGAIIPLHPRSQVAVAALRAVVRPAELQQAVDQHTELFVAALDEEAVVVAGLHHRRHEALAELLLAEHLANLLLHRLHSRRILVLGADRCQLVLQRRELCLQPGDRLVVG